VVGSPKNLDLLGTAIESNKFIIEEISSYKHFDVQIQYLPGKSILPYLKFDQTSKDLTSKSATDIRDHMTRLVHYPMSSKLNEGVYNFVIIFTDDNSLKYDGEALPLIHLGDQDYLILFNLSEASVGVDAKKLCYMMRNSLKGLKNGANFVRHDQADYNISDEILGSSQMDRSNEDAYLIFNSLKNLSSHLEEFEQMVDRLEVRVTTQIRAIWADLFHWDKLNVAELRAKVYQDYQVFFQMMNSDLVDTYDKFPEDYKIAIYFPLIFPVAMVYGTYLKYLIGKRKEKKQKDAAAKESTTVDDTNSDSKLKKE